MLKCNINSHFRLTKEEKEIMMSCKMLLLNKLVENLDDKVYLHRPTKIVNHSLSLYKINTT